MTDIRNFFEPKAKRPPMPTRPPPKRKRIQTKPIGYEKLLDGMKTVAEQFKVMKNGVKVVADVNDLINMMKYTGSTDIAYDSIPDLKYHPLCNKHNFSSFSKKDKPNCLCSQEDLRYLFHFKVPVDKIKTKKYNDFIVGSRCVQNLIEDENIPEELRDSLQLIHNVMLDSQYYKCKRCGERNGHIGIHGNKKKGSRTDYCSVCSKILTKINNEIKRCERKREWGKITYWRKVIRNFQDLETFIPFNMR